jgi:hypothetical protein
MVSSLKNAKFERLGHIFNADGRYGWMHSHASNPTPVHLQGDVYRIFFSARAEDKRSRVGYIDFDIVSRKIESISRDPVIVPGEKGYFDDSGISCGCIVKDDNDGYLFYYIGWNLAVTVPFHNSIGLATGSTLDLFHKSSPVPILDRSLSDPLSISYPWVIREGDCWRMWYGSHLSWRTEQYEMVHVLKHAISDDGRKWTPAGPIAIDKLDDEFAFSRPCVIYEDGRYKMWFSVRGEQYSIGYAESDDGLRWERSQLQIGGSGSGWDSESSSYAVVFDHAGTRYAVYCGNRYGATGFGLAVLT